MVPGRRLQTGEAHARPVVQPLALGPRPGREAVPGGVWQRGGEIGRGLLPEAARQHRPQLLVAAYRQDKGPLVLLKKQRQATIRAVDLVAHHPGERHPRSDGTRNHALCQLRLGGKRYRPGDPRRRPARAILRPVLRQIQFAIDQRVPATAGISEKYPNLAVLSKVEGSMRPAVPLYCRATPADLLPFLRNPVSSITRTPSAAPRCSTTYSRHRSRAASAAHSVRLSTRCVRNGRAPPICSANCQPFLRSTALSRPSR